MAFTFLGPDPLEDKITAVLRRLEAGEPAHDIEIPQVDIKEEPGRRGTGGKVLPGRDENERAAKYLAEEMASMANTPGGGAIILGIADDGARIGTELDSDWLRHRIWKLTDQRLTVTIREGDLDGARLLVLDTHEAIEPIRYGNKIKWRVDDNSVEVDATTWHAGKIQRTVDWSAQPSGHTINDVNAVALAIARRYLRAGDEADLDLAEASDEDLIRRLNLVDGEGRLTNAGSLLLVATPDIGIDYIRRDYHGGDSTNRIRASGPLLEQVSDVDRASQSNNRTIHMPEGFAHGQLRAIPLRAIREAIVNGVVHRDWNSPHPTTVEHVDDEITITSPGGFIGGISPSNIITHPAVPRYRALAEAMAALRLAEREGIGIDRMVRDMLAIGRPEPEISEIEGPYVRVGLLGGDPDPIVVESLSAIEPASAAAAVDVLLLIDQLTRRGWVDISTAAPTVQRPAGETAAALHRLEEATIDGEPLIRNIKGVPADHDPAYRLGAAAAKRLDHRLSHLATPEGRRAQILDWALSRGRVSTTELSDLSDISVPYSGTLLTALEEEGLLVGSRENKRGRGFYYLPVDRSAQAEA